MKAGEVLEAHNQAQLQMSEPGQGIFEVTVIEMML